MDDDDGEGVDEVEALYDGRAYVGDGAGDESESEGEGEVNAYV